MQSKYTDEQFLKWAIAPRPNMGLRDYLSIPVGKFTRWLYLRSPASAEVFCKMFYFGRLRRSYLRLFWSLRSLDDDTIPDYRIKAAEFAPEDIYQSGDLMSKEEHEAMKTHILAIYKSGKLRDLPPELQKLRKLARFNRLYANTQSILSILDNGFPMPEKFSEPAFEPDPNRSLYFLHHSLPIHSNGYATRSHSVLKGVLGQGRNITAITRLGYPQDRGVNFRDNYYPNFERVDEVPYHRLQSSDSGIDKLPMLEYLQANILAHEGMINELRPAILHGASNYINGITVSALANKFGLISLYEVRGLWEITRESREADFANSDTYKLSVKLETQACQAADHVVTITEALKDELVRRGVDKNKISVIPNGVVVEQFQPQSPNLKLKASLGFEQNDVIIGFIGSLVDYEGLDYLLEALAMLRKRGVESLKIMIVGDGGALYDLRILAKRLGVEDLVIFTGRIPHTEVADHYSIVDIAPFPRKGLKVCEMVAPLKPFEAMAMEKTVIISDVAAMCEFIEDNVTGLIFEKDNPLSLADTLYRLYDDEGLRTRLGKAGREFVKRERDWSLLSKKFTDLYEQLLKDRQF